MIERLFIGIIILFLINSEIKSISLSEESKDIVLSCFEKRGVWENFEIVQDDHSVILDKKGKILFFSNTGILLKTLEIPDSGFPSAIRLFESGGKSYLLVCDTLNKRLVEITGKNSRMIFHKVPAFPVDIAFSDNQYHVLDNRNSKVLLLDREFGVTGEIALKGLVDEKELLTSIVIKDLRIYLVSWHGNLYEIRKTGQGFSQESKVNFKGSSFTSVRIVQDDLIMTDFAGNVLYYSLQENKVIQEIKSLLNPVDALEKNNRLFILNSGDYSIRIFKKQKVLQKEKISDVDVNQSASAEVIKTEEPADAMQKLENLKLKPDLPAEEEVRDTIQETIQGKTEPRMIDLDKVQKKIKFITLEKTRLIADIEFEFDAAQFSYDDVFLREKLSSDNFKIFFNSVEVAFKKINILSKNGNSVRLEFILTKNSSPVEIILILKWNYDILQTKFDLKKSENE